MGICDSCISQRDPAETMIIEKEEILKMKHFSVSHIKNSFFDLNEKEIISYNNVMIGMKKLHNSKKEFEEFFNQETETLRTFHSILKGVSINPEEKDITQNNFKFKNFMIFLFFLSNSYSKDKIQETLRMEGKSTLNQQDVQKLLKEIFVTVLDCSLQLLIQDMNEGKKIIEGKKFKIYRTKIDPIVEESAKELYVIGSKDKNPIELGVSFYQLIGKQHYNAATTDGIRKVIKFKMLQEKLIEFQKSFQPQAVQGVEQGVQYQEQEVQQVQQQEQGVQQQEQGVQQQEIKEQDKLVEAK